MMSVEPIRTIVADNNPNILDIYKNIPLPLGIYLLHVSSATVLGCIAGPLPLKNLATI